MDNHEKATAITDSQLMRVIQPQLDDLEARVLAEARGVIVAALSTVPTNDEVLRMIDERVTSARRELQESINSIDAHLRTAEGRVSEAGKRMDRATDKFETFVDEFRNLFTDIKGKLDSVVRDVNALNNDVDGVRTQANTDRTELTQTIDKLDDLRGDVHGDPTKPQMPSLFRAIALTNDSVNALNARISKYDNAVAIINRVWQNKIGKAVIMLMVGGFATDVMYNATHILQAILVGKVP